MSTNLILPQYIITYRVKNRNDYAEIQYWALHHGIPMNNSFSHSNWLGSSYQCITWSEYIDGKWELSVVTDPTREDKIVNTVDDFKSHFSTEPMDTSSWILLYVVMLVIALVYAAYLLIS